VKTTWGNVLKSGVGVQQVASQTKGLGKCGEQISWRGKAHAKDIGSQSRVGVGSTEELDAPGFSAVGGRFEARGGSGKGREEQGGTNQLGVAKRGNQRARGGAGGVRAGVMCGQSVWEATKETAAHGLQGWERRRKDRRKKWWGGGGQPTPQKNALLEGVCRNLGDRE